MTFTLIVQFLSGLVTLTGGFYLWQWLFGQFAHQGLVSITMKTNAALCFVLIGLSLLIQMKRPQRKLAAAVVRVFASVVLTIAVLTLLENIFSLNFGIDQLLAHEPPGALGVIYPNRMGIPASFSFVLCSLALLLKSEPKPKVFVIQLFGSIVLLIGLLGVMGYLFGAKALFDVASFTAVAFPTALLLCGLGTVLMLMDPWEGYTKEFTSETGRQLFLKFFLPASVIAVSTGYLRLIGDRLALYDFATGTGLRTVLFITLFIWMLYLNAKELNARIASQNRTQNTLRFLVDLNAVTQHLTHPSEIMAVTAGMLGEHLKADRCAYARIEDESICVVTGDYPKNVPSIVGRWRVADFGRECERLMRSNQAYVVVDTDSDPRISEEDLKAYRAATIRAAICVPLHKSGKFTAAMAVHQAHPRHWTAEEIKLVGMVVARCWESLERSKTIHNLEQLTADLEDRVAERTQQLEDQAKRLRQLAVELTQVEQEERRRLAEVLHDHLQQYLVAAKMRMGLLARSAVSVDKAGLQEAESYIDQASQASRQLTVELRPPVLYEGGLAAGLRYLLQKMREQHKLDVHLSIEGKAEPGSDSVKVMIYQCVQELLFNIVKYAKVSECFVRLARRDTGDILITVEDRGAGFNVDKVAVSHSGFGLFSIRERVRALGGELQILSYPHQGSIFTLSIPDKVASPSFHAQGDALVNDPQLARNESMKEGIVLLVADDHPIVRQSLANLLMAQPFIKEVLEAANGKEAVQKAETYHPDIVLMDINMPVLNGIEATRILCRRNPHSKVIGLSVQAEDGIVHTMKEAGAVAHFYKGDDTASLLEAIKKFSMADKWN